jgi:ATP phosphoribosyltransferase regulatory subunit
MSSAQTTDLPAPVAAPSTPIVAPDEGYQARIPFGVADYFWEDALARRDLEAKLLHLFRTWGYTDIIPPMFEYSETYRGRASQGLQKQLYTFVERDGSTLVLRADMTIPVARLAGVRLHDVPAPQRFCYAESVFRYVETQAGRQREFWQAGCELIGAATPQADAEILALTAHAMHVAQLTEFRLVVGQMQYFDGILRDLNLSPPETAALTNAVNRNSAEQLAEFLRTTQLRTQQRRTLEELPLLSGPDAQRVIDHAGRHCLNHTMHNALANLRAIYDGLAAHGLEDRVHIDLTEINNLGYYTGLTFEVLTPGLGFPVGGGGRYDNLVGTFGPAKPAVGVALGLDRILAAARSRAGAAHAPHPVGPDFLVDAAGNATALAAVGTLRSLGVRVAAQLPTSEGHSIRESAKTVGAKFALQWTGNGFEVHDLQSDDAPVETLQPHDFARLVERCRELPVQSPAAGIRS